MGGVLFARTNAPVQPRGGSLQIRWEHSLSRAKAGCRAIAGSWMFETSDEAIPVAEFGDGLGMGRKRPGSPGLSSLFSGSPTGNRTPVCAVRGRRPDR